jgi:hypothetical protein
MLDGGVCEGCGTYLADPVGHPRLCAGCEDVRAASDAAAQSTSTDRVPPDGTNDEHLPF